MWSFPWEFHVNTGDCATQRGVGVATKVWTVVCTAIETITTGEI